MASTIGHYELGPAIGHGTVGTVYRGRDQRSGQPVALKILLSAVSHDENIVLRFEREMLILSKLDHTGIVHYYGGQRQGSQLYYAMELVEGGTLKDVLRAQGRLTWPLAAECGRQIASALQHAHNHGVIHRDLKPANLFISDEGRLKLGDFGIARDVNSADLTDTGLTVGTYAYMSPEQIRGDHRISPQTDLYALGCLLYEMLTGRQPYPGDNFARIFDQHLASPPPDPRESAPDCPQPLAELVQALMAKNPEERPFSARAVQGTLTEVLENVADRDELRLPLMHSEAQPLDMQLAAGPVAANVSWLSLSILLVVIVGIVLLAMYFAH